MRELADEGSDHARGVRQLGAQHHRLPVRRHVRRRDLRRDAVRRGADALLPAASARGVLPRKFKIAFEGCREDHALASINDIGWRARIVDGRRGFRVTVAGGTSILPVSGYVLYDFLPGRGDARTSPRRWSACSTASATTSIAQRNRMKFTIKALGWDDVPRAVRGGARRVQARGRRAAAVRSADAVAIGGGARLDAGGAADAAGRRRGGQHARERPGHHAGHRPAAAAAATPTCAGCAATSASSGRPATATSPCACRSATSRPGRCACSPISPTRTATATMRLTVDQNVLYRWVKTDVGRAVLSAAGGRGPRRARCRHAQRRRQLPRRGELPAGGDAVARARPRADRAPERAARSRGHGAVGPHQDQRLPERLRPASHRLDRLPGQRAQGRAAGPCRSTSCWSAAAARTRASRTSARSCRRCRCTG